MPTSTADVVIVGAGVNGAATAFYLASLGVTDVTLVEAAYPGAGATSRGMGLLRQYHANEPEAKLAIRSIEVFKNWEEQIGGDVRLRGNGIHVARLRAQPRGRAEERRPA